MHPLASKLAEKVRRRDEPLASLAYRIASNVRALAYGRVFLRGCSAVGARARAFGRPRVVNEGTIRLGDDFGLGCTFGASSLVAGPAATLEVGDGVTVNYGTSIHAWRSVRLGDRVLVGPYCVIEDADVPGDREHAEPIEIGDDVWLAARVVVRPGARIGSGAVIAAGSVVEGEIPPNTIASGAPARVLRVRGAGPVAEVVSQPPEVRRAASA